MSKLVSDPNQVSVKFHYTTEGKRASVSHTYKKESAWTAKDTLKILLDAVVILTVLQMGLATELTSPEWIRVWRMFDVAVLVIFFAEMGAALFWQARHYFKDPLNNIDFAVAWVSLLDVILAFIVDNDKSSMDKLGFIKILRLLRLVRIAKLLKVFPAFRIILESIHASFVTLSWFIAFLGIIMYVAAVACVIMIGRDNSGYPGFNDDSGAIYNSEASGFNNYVYFGTVWRSILTLFNLTLLNDLSLIMRPINEVQPYMTIAFVFFILVMTLCVLNSMIGVIVQKTVNQIVNDEGQEKEKRAAQLEALEQLASLMFSLDLNCDDKICVDEFIGGGSNPQLQKLLRSMDLPVGFTFEELFALLDADHSGSLSRSEFIGGIFRLIYSNDFQHSCLARLGEYQVKKKIDNIRLSILNDIRAENRELLNQIRGLLGSEKQATCETVPSEWRNEENQRSLTRAAAYKAAAEYFPELRQAMGLDPAISLFSPDAGRNTSSKSRSTSTTDKCQGTFATLGSKNENRAQKKLDMQSDRVSLIQQNNANAGLEEVPDKSGCQQRDDFDLVSANPGPTSSKPYLPEEIGLPMIPSTNPVLMCLPTVVGHPQVELGDSMNSWPTMCKFGSASPS